MTGLLLVRHGETEWSISGRHTGRTDIPLSAAGRHQADQIAINLSGREFAAVWSSPLQRALETCRRALPDREPTVDDELVEWDYGNYEGITTAEVRRDIADWTVWTHPITGGESVEQVGERADSVISRALEVDGNVGLFSHGQFLRILAARWIGLSADTGRLLALDTATVSMLGFEHETRVIRYWNEDYHLRVVK